jgi:hypothetical protein
MRLLSSSERIITFLPVRSSRGDPAPLERVSQQICW